MIFLLLLLFSGSSASELSCVPHFPLKESVEIFKKLIAKYAVPVTRKDENGNEWMNNLITKKQNLEIDGVRYYFNDNRLSPEMTFYFDNSLVLDSVPVFVVDEDQLQEWRPDYPDKTYALTKISHECEVGQRACGLKCCQKESYEIQKGFIELSHDGDLPTGTTYSYNDITYMLETKNNSQIPECFYDLSFYDTLTRKGKVDGNSISTIYFSCPERHTCCGLSCMPSPEIAFLRKPRKVEVFSLKFDDRKKIIVLWAGTALTFLVFIIITAMNYRDAPGHHTGFQNGTIRSESRCIGKNVHTQTSNISLHLDAEARTLLSGSHLA